MPLSDIWTLEPAGSPGSAATLSARGFSGATLTRASQTAATLTLTMPRADALTADLSAWTWASGWVLRRSGAVFFRGYLSRVPDLNEDAGSGSVQMVFHDVLWMLDRVDYTQEWTHAAGATLQAMRTARARLAWNPRTGVRQTTKQALADVIDAAAVAGVSVGLDTSAMPDLTPPPIEATQKKCGELIRDLLRWHPDCIARIVSTDLGDTLTVTQRDTTAVRTISLGSAPLDTVRLRRRDDLVVSSVHVTYEAEIPRAAQFPSGEDEPDIIRTRPRLALFKDIYPPASPLDWRSLSIVIPVPMDDLGGAGGVAGSQPHSVAIKTRPLPETGSYDAEAEKFYLKQLGLEGLGLTTSDIKLPTATVGDIKAHTVTFAHPADDPNDPLFEMPSPINPASSPVWRPPSVEDLPRYLVAGTLAEWMKVEAAEVRCQATVAVSKAAVDALPPRNRAIFMQAKPRQGTVQSVAAYLLEADVVVRGTTAKTKNYVNWVAGGTGNVAMDNAAAAAAAEERVKIPNLALRLWSARSTAPWEGSVGLTAEEAGSVSYLGQVIRLQHADKPEWSTMRAYVQSESLTLGTGQTNLEIGLPEHLEPQDFIALATPVREAARTAAAQPTVPTEEEELGEDEEDPRMGGVFPGSVEPVSKVYARGLGSDALWDLEVVDAAAGTVRLVAPGLVKRDSGYSSASLVTVTNLNNTFTAAAGSALILEVTPAGAVTAKVVTMDWTGWPYPIESEETTPAGNYQMKFYRMILWTFVSSTTDPKAVKVKDGIFAEKLMRYDSHLQLEVTEMEDAGGRIIPTLELIPAVGCLRS